MELVVLTVGGETLRTTPDHPFYVKGKGFLGAGELTTGDRLLDAEGQVLPVEDTKREQLEEPVKVYNFQVEDFHTYHVGECGVLVHNANYGNETSYGNKTVNGYDTKVNVGQQNKHDPRTNEYKNALNSGQTKSIMYGDTNDIQNLLSDKAGTGEFFGANKERVNFGQVIGQYVDPDTGVGVETTIGIIHYGKKGAHIVPARPN